MALNTQLSKKTKDIKSPTVTVLMSVYNGEKYLRQAIDSILNQTFKDFEFLIINDGSTDKTLEILQSYNDSRIKIINNEKNIGLTKSLNKGLRIASGKYIARQDADDVSLPERLKKQVKFLEKNKTVGLLGSSYYIIDANDKRIAIDKISTEKNASSKQTAHFICHGSVLIRKKCLEKVGTYREIFKYAQDYDLWLRVANKFEIRNIREPLYNLRITDNSISSKKKSQQDLYASLAIKLAEEREVYGKDRLDLISYDKAIKVRDRIFNTSGIKKRKMFSHNYSTLAQAAFALGEYKKSCNYAINALSQYILNCCAWKVLMKIIIRKFKNKFIKLIKTKILK